MGIITIKWRACLELFLELLLFRMPYLARYFPEVRRNELCGNAGTGVSAATDQVTII